MNAKITPIRDCKILPFRPDMARWEVVHLEAGGYGVVDTRSGQIVRVYEWGLLAMLRRDALNHQEKRG